MISSKAFNELIDKHDLDIAHADFAGDIGDSFYKILDTILERNKELEKRVSELEDKLGE